MDYQSGSSLVEEANLPQHGEQSFEFVAGEVPTFSVL